MRSKKITRKTVPICFFTAALIVFIILAALSYPLKTVKYEIVSDKLQNAYRIVHISDLHSCKFGNDMSELKEKLDEAIPDIIVLTGDIYDDVADNCNTQIFLEYAAERYPCFYVAGNHELRSGKWNEFAARAQSLGINVLTADYMEFEELTLFGTETPQMIPTMLYNFDSEHGNDEGKSMNILLSHYPECYEDYVQYNRFDLVLCGHAHGGQWRIPFSQNGLYAPGQGIFPKYSGGRFDSPTMTMIVSRGLTHGKAFIPRILNNPEFVIIDILPKS